MIGVGGVLELDLPVAGKAELVLAERGQRIARALLHEQVDPFLRPAKEINKRLDVVLEGCKDQPGIFLDAERFERELALVDRAGVAGLIGPAA